MNLAKILPAGVRLAISPLSWSNAVLPSPVLGRPVQEVAIQPGWPAAPRFPGQAVSATSTKAFNLAVHAPSQACADMP